MVSMARLYSVNISSACGRPYRLMALPRPIARPVVAIPPLRPEAPQPTVCCVEDDDTCAVAGRLEGGGQAGEAGADDGDVGALGHGLRR